MTTHSYPTDLGLPLVGLGADFPWPPGAPRLELVACVGGREIWSAQSPDGEPISVVTFAEAPSPEERAALGATAAKLAELASAPGVVRVLESKPAKGYLCVEHLVGVLADSPALGLRLARKLEILTALSLVVSGLHARGWVHGGLSPEVVGLDPRLAPRLLEAQGSGGGSAHVYAAPEVVEGASPDARADVYSLGRILAFLLVGADPPLETATIPRLDYLAQSPAGLARIVRRATCAERLLRYSSVEALVADLSRYGEHDQVGMVLPNAVEHNFTGLSSPPASAARRPAVMPPAPATRASRPRQSWVLASAAGCLAAVGLATLLVSPVQQAERWLARRELASAAPEARGAAVRRLIALGERDFARTSFRGADLAGADLAFAELGAAALTGAKLDHADLAGANLELAELTDASALGADWSGARVEGASGLETVRCDDATLPPEGWACRDGLLGKEEDPR